MFKLSRKTKNFLKRNEMYFRISAIFAGLFLLLFIFLNTRVWFNEQKTIHLSSVTCTQGCQHAAPLRPSDIKEAPKVLPTDTKSDLDFKASVDFQRSLFRVLKHEGGYVNDQDDPGGETKFGISKKSYPHLNIKNLTLNDISSIYYEDFWQKASLEKVSRDELQHKLFDMVVQFGVEGGVRIWKKALANEILEDTGKTIDMSHVTNEQLIEMTNKADPLHLLIALRIAMMNYYLSLVKKNPTLKKYLHGWLTRAHDDDGKLLSQQSKGI